MANIGAHPIDADSPVGQVRLNVGDTESTELSPPEAGKRDYANFSDAELSALLATADGSVMRATAWAWRKLAGIAAATGATIKTNDLGHSTERRASELRAIAADWTADADAADDASSDDFLEIVRYPGRDDTDAALPAVL